MLKVSLTALAVALTVTACSAAPAYAATINDVINATNFVVANQCSGTLISLKYKLVLTNDHCLQGYVDKVSKEETGKDGKIESVTREQFKDMELKQKAYKDFDEVGAVTLQAKILYHTTKYDLALLKIKADSIPQAIASQVLPASKKVTRGDRIYVVGNPLLLDANLNEGVISSTTRTIHWDQTNEDVHYYGIDAGVNPGNSGGALYNTDLDLIGVPAAGYRGATGLGFAIPAETIRAFLAEHCYSDVFDPAAKTHAACEQAKIDKINESRAKAGLPAVEAPAEDSVHSDGGTTMKLKPLVIAPPSVFGSLLDGLAP